MHYKTNFTTPVSLSHALDIVSLMSELKTLWLWKQWTISFNSLWNIDLKPCFELLLGYDWLQKKDLYCAVLGSVFLASHGGSRPSVPPFLYYTLWKTCCTNCPRSTATLGSVTPGPEGDERRCWCRDNQQKWRQDSTRKLPKNQRQVGWRSEQARIGFWCIWP